jgi:hypothetical protein
VRHALVGLRSVVSRQALSKLMGWSVAAPLVAVLIIAAPLSAQQAPTQQAPAQPTAPARPLNWAFDFSLEYGGDVYATLIFTDGDRQELLAGQGGTISVGGDYRFRSMPRIGVRALAGIKWSTNAAENSNISFTRIPIEVVGSYYLDDDWRVGAGLAYHAIGKVNGDGFFPDFEFDPAAGYTAEIGWRWVALTYTGIEYTSDGGPAIDASAFGVSLNWVFGKR